MNPLSALLWSKWRIARHTIASVRGESKLKVIFVSISAVLLAVGIFASSRFGFRLLEDLGGELLSGGTLKLSDLIMSRLLALFALALLAMLSFSNMIVAFATFYRSREVPYLILSPISNSSFFVGRFVECVSFSSWAAAYLGTPMLLAYGIETDAPLPFYLALFAFFLPFVMIPAALGTTATIVIVRLLGYLRRWHLIALGVALMAALLAYFRGRSQTPDLQDPPSFAVLIDLLGSPQSPFLPSHWLARGVLSAATGQIGEAVFYLLLLIANALFFTWLAAQASEAWFYRGWSALLGNDEMRPRTADKGRLGFVEALLRPLPQPTRALVIKDVKMFWRDATQWSQFVLFFGIMAVYVANLGNARGATDQDLWQAMGTLLNMTAGMLILASLTTRFVYPLVSLEGRRFWILGLAPLDKRRIVAQKFWLSVATTAVFTIGLSILSGWQLGLDRLSFGLSVAGTAATTLALCGLAVGLGSLFPNFEEDNPSRIVSGMGGTLNFLLSMVYVALILAAQAVILLWSRLEAVVGANAYPWVVAAVAGWISGLTAVTCLVPLRLGLRHLEHAEF